MPHHISAQLVLLWTSYPASRIYLRNCVWALVAIGCGVQIHEYTSKDGATYLHPGTHLGFFVAILKNFFSSGLFIDLVPQQIPGICLGFSASHVQPGDVTLYFPSLQHGGLPSESQRRRSYIATNVHSKTNEVGTWQVLTSLVFEACDMSLALHLKQRCCGSTTLESATSARTINWSRCARPAKTPCRSARQSDDCVPCASVKRYCLQKVGTGMEIQC